MTRTCLPYNSARCWWMNEIATEPSPEATRLTEPWRTSPAAKMPGTRVSTRLYTQKKLRRRQDGDAAKLVCWEVADVPGNDTDRFPADGCLQELVVVRI